MLWNWCVLCGCHIETEMQFRLLSGADRRKGIDFIIYQYVWPQSALLCYFTLVNGDPYIRYVLLHCVIPLVSGAKAHCCCLVHFFHTMYPKCARRVDNLLFLNDRPDLKLEAVNLTPVGAIILAFMFTQTNLKAYFWGACKFVSALSLSRELPVRLGLLCSIMCSGHCTHWIGVHVMFVVICLVIVQCSFSIRYSNRDCIYTSCLNVQHRHRVYRVQQPI